MTDKHLVEEFVGREELLRGRFLHVVRDTVRLPNGNTATREYVLHPGAVAVVPMLDDGRLVLERQYRHAAGRVVIEIPAGKVDPGEGALVCGQR
ncbi:MAG TPA: NUDIX hydrolase, partial [Ramlibacter sp.]